MTQFVRVLANIKPDSAWRSLYSPFPNLHCKLDLKKKKMSKKEQVLRLQCTCFLPIKARDENVFFFFCNEHKHLWAGHALATHAGWIETAITLWFFFNYRRALVRRFKCSLWTGACSLVKEHIKWEVGEGAGRFSSPLQCESDWPCQPFVSPGGPESILCEPSDSQRPHSGVMYQTEKITYFIMPPAYQRMPHPIARFLFDASQCIDLKTREG